MTATMMLLVGAGLIFAGILISLSIIGVISKEKSGFARTLSAIEALDSVPDPLKEELERPFYERVLLPMGDSLVTLGKRLTRADTAQRLQHRLDIAGNPTGWDVNRIIGLKAVGLFGFGGLTLIYMFATGQPFTRMVVAAVATAVFGFLLPNLLLHNAGQKREETMLKALPDALDLMTISVEAGLGFDAALQRVARDTTGPLSGEFVRLTQEMQIGTGRMEAMRNMADRTSLKDLKSFALAMVQADSFGIPIGRVLRVQATEMRTRRRQRAEEKAQQMPVKILFPLVFFILPCLFIVVLGPAVISLAEFFGNQGG